MLSLAPAQQAVVRAEQPELVWSPTPVTSPAAEGPAAMRRDDWEALFTAATERLHQLVEDMAWRGAAVDPRRAGADPVELLRECVAALQQLQRELAARPAEALAPRADEAAFQRAADGRILAAHDKPGNLSTRAQFEVALASSLRAGTAGAQALVCIGLDGFNRINELHGRDVGDATLCIVARRLARALRTQDAVCRLGGDRFACLLQSPTDREQLSRVACKLFDAVAAPLRVGAVTLSVLPSIGIAVCPADGDSGPTLLRHAQAAMGRAKRRQQGYAFFEPRSDL